jgi:hypothetical protein
VSYFAPMALAPFDLYWRLLGLPLSRAKGLVIDAIPFSVVEVSLWMGTAATLWLLLSFGIRRGPLRSARGRLLALLLGPVFLIALGLGQGAFPWSLAPTALRAPLSARLLANDSLPENVFRAWIDARAAALRDSLGTPEGWARYRTLDEATALRACDTLLDGALAGLRLTPGRRVRAFKDMGPWTTTLGLAYGGPAFHDPFFGEIAIVSDREMPAPLHWRLIAACHEAAHAKGYTREMDAEILTQLALANAPDPRLRELADIHLLRKAGVAVQWPDSLVAESRRVRARREATEARQPVVRALRDLAERFDMRNQGAKYGERDAREAWNPRHPFFATVRAGERRLDFARDSATAATNGAP